MPSPARTVLGEPGRVAHPFSETGQCTPLRLFLLDLPSGNRAALGSSGDRDIS